MLGDASCLRNADGSLGQSAVVVAPAKASQVAQLIIEAYELTPREVEVTRALARGLSTNEIAAELHLSRYTVQDHLKSVYEKTGVCSRGGAGRQDVRRPPSGAARRSAHRGRRARVALRSW